MISSSDIKKAIALENLWLPYSQMKTAPYPSRAVSTQGTKITLDDGRVLIDGIASWWTACHGYNHPHIREEVTKQLNTMPHIMFGGMVHPQAERLSKRLAALMPKGLNKVFFSDSGSISMEVAVKVALQSRINIDKPQKKRILNFKYGYHGDTWAMMNICDPEEGMHHRLSGILAPQPNLSVPNTEDTYQELKKYLTDNHQHIAAMTIEPLVQGAGGMRFHKPETLIKLRALCDEYDILLILDEVFTGFGRTGSFFAFEQAGIKPDIVALSKALTAGTMGLGATVVSDELFNLFLSDDPECALMHGPTFMANPLACAAANASLDIFEQINWKSNVKGIEAQLKDELSPLAKHPKVKDVRTMGAIGVVEIDGPINSPQLNHQFAKDNVWIRPFRNIIYLTPALNIESSDLSTLTDAINRTVRATF